VTDRAARMDAVWEKHLRGELVSLDEFLARRAAAACLERTGRPRPGLAKCGRDAPSR